MIWVRNGSDDMEKLKPCPLCGGYVHIDNSPSYFRDHMLYCEGCDMYFSLDSVHATEDDLILAFNKRVAQNRVQGKWIEYNPKNDDKCRLIKCSECGLTYIVGYNIPYKDWIERRNYCQRCGAVMKQT